MAISSKPLWIEAIRRLAVSRVGTKMAQSVEKTVFTLAMPGFALAISTVLRPGNRKQLPAWLQMPIARFFS